MDLLQFPKPFLTTSSHSHCYLLLIRVPSCWWRSESDVGQAFFFQNPNLPVPHLTHSSQDFWGRFFLEGKRSLSPQDQEIALVAYLPIVTLKVWLTGLRSSPPHTGYFPVTSTSQKGEPNLRLSSVGASERHNFSFEIQDKDTATIHRHTKNYMHICSSHWVLNYSKHNRSRDSLYCGLWIV
jgi:hypothetical protein